MKFAWNWISRWRIYEVDPKNLHGIVHSIPEKFKNAFFIYTAQVWRTVHTNPSLHTRGIWKRRPWVFLWTEKFENEAFRRKRWRHVKHKFPWLNFSQTQTQMTDGLHQFWRETFDVFSEWNLRFPIPPGPGVVGVILSTEL